jgi:hypothetical protein
MYDSDIQSMNAAAIGAKSWMAPQINRVCLWRPTITKMWKDEMNPGMGAYMVGFSQMIPNASN